MKNAMGKTTFREIKQSFSRWLAILAICALGVGFFVGLKVSKEAFVKTGDEYLGKLNFFDFELISTLGIDEDNIDDIRKVDGVKTVEGSYSTDCLVEVEGEADESSASDDLARGDKVAKLYTVMDEINLVDLVAGRMPENENECVVDYNRFSPEDIGLKIRISDANYEDTLDMLKYDEYEIVGLVSSPIYLNFERGSTKLGDGTVNCYIYIPKGGWDMEVFTEAYVSMVETAPILTDEYDEIADVMEDRLSDAFDAVAMSRYDDVMDEADKEIKKAEKKIRNAKKDLEEGEKEVADNEKKLEDAKKEIADNEKKLEDARKEIKDGEKKLADAKSEIEENEKTLADSKELLDSAKAELEQNDAELEAGKAYIPVMQYQAARAQIDAGWDEYNQNYAAYEAGVKELEDAKAEIAKEEKKLKDAKKEVKDGEKKIEDAKKEIADGEKKIADAKKDIKKGKEKLEDGEADLEDAREEVNDIDEPDTYVLGRDTNIGYACFENDTDIVNGIAKVFPVFFFLVAALVVMTTMTRMIDDQRTQIGVLKALGYSRRRILGKYLWYSASASLIGGVIGFYVGSYLFPWVIWEAYGMMYGFADLIPVFNYTVGGLSVLVALLCAVGTTLFSCWSDMKEVPAELIRPKAPAIGKRIRLERIGFIWNRMPFLHKVSARNIFRYKKRFFMMILGICGCTALLVTGMGISDSIKNVVSAQYDDIYKVDYIATFEDDMTEEEEAEFVSRNSDVIDNALFLYTISADARHNEITKSVNLVVCDTNDVSEFSEFIDLHTERGKVEKGVKTPLAFPGKGECIINTNLAANLSLKIGDTIRITDSDMNSLSATVVGLCENHIYNYMYITSETYEESWGKFEPNSAFIVGGGEDKSEGGAALMNDDDVSAVSVTKDFKDRVSNMMKALDYVILLVISCAGALAFIVLYNLTNINITERIREIATIKVLGFYANETSQYVFRENMVLTAISALVGLPLGQLLHTFVMNQIQIDLISFDIHIEPVSYVIAVLATFGFAIIVNFVMRFKLEKINMAESLKSIE